MRYRTKVTLTLLAVVSVTGGVLLWLSHRNASQLVFRLIQERVLSVAVTTAPQIDGDAHERLTREGREASLAHRDDENVDYVTARAPMRDARDANRDPADAEAAHQWLLPITFIYTLRPRTDGETDPSKPYEYVVDAEEDGEDKSYIGDLVTFNEGAEIIPAMGSAQVDSVFAQDEFGRWLSAFAPVRNSAGENVALLGVDVAADAVIAQMDRLLMGGLAALLLALLVAAIASFFLSARVTAPLNALQEQVALIRRGDFETRVPIESRDEFGELGEAVHRMADGLREREAFKEALVRFVSSGSTDSVIDPGSEASEIDEGSGADLARRVTVLVCSLRNVDAVFASLPASRLVALLDDWYGTAIDVILRHRGAIEKSTGQLITATFGAPLRDASQERHAVEAALTLQRELAELRKRWNLAGAGGLSLAAAIHGGRVAVREEGDLRFMDPASIREIISTTRRIQEDSPGVARPQGVVISETIASRLKGTIPLSQLPPLDLGDEAEALPLHSLEMPAPSN